MISICPSEARQKKKLGDPIATRLEKSQRRELPQHPKPRGTRNKKEHREEEQERRATHRLPPPAHIKIDHSSSRVARRRAREREHDRGEGPTCTSACGQGATMGERGVRGGAGGVAWCVRVRLGLLGLGGRSTGGGGREGSGDVGARGSLVSRFTNR
jgi:hypothetical protein